jgi:hypothetical protein
MTEPPPAPSVRSDDMTADLSNGQTKVDILTRHGIPLEFEERQFRVRPRTIKRDREWLDEVTTLIMARVSPFMATDAEWSVSTIIALLGDATSEMLDFIIAYDETDELPPREWIEEHAYTAQITTAFTTLLEVAYAPFAVSRRLLPADRAAAIIGSLLSFAIERYALDASSARTVTPSPIGVIARPKRSTKRSPAVSSAS